jgi:hypothetical protein
LALSTEWRESAHFACCCASGESPLTEPRADVRPWQPPVEQLALTTAAVNPVPTLAEPDRPTDGIIDVELPSGLKLRLTGAVDEVAFRWVLSALS